MLNAYEPSMTSKQFNDMLLRAQPIAHSANGKGSTAHAAHKKNSS